VHSQQAHLLNNQPSHLQIIKPGIESSLMSLEGFLSTPVIKDASVDRLLKDVGLTPDGKEDGDTSGRHISLWDRAKDMALEQGLSLRSMNRDVVRSIKKAGEVNYPRVDNFQRIFTIASMAVMRVFSYELGQPFIEYVQGLEGTRLEDFGIYMACATPLTSDNTILDEVLNGPEIPEIETDLKRGVYFMSHFSVDSDHADKFRIGAGCTFLAIQETWAAAIPNVDHVKPSDELEQMRRLATILEPAKDSSTKPI
jgi:hypothetical protein